MRKNNYDRYEYLEVELIEKAVKGDNEALEKVISRYEAYASVYLQKIAVSDYGIDLRLLPEEDLLQIVWMKFIKIIQMKFKIY